MRPKTTSMMCWRKRGAGEEKARRKEEEQARQKGKEEEKRAEEKGQSQKRGQERQKAGKGQGQRTQEGPSTYGADLVLFTNGERIGHVMTESKRESIMVNLRH